MSHIRLLVGDLSQTAGSSLYCEELAIRLSLLGHSVSVICFRATDRVRNCCNVLETGRAPNRAAPLLWRFAFHLDESHCARALRRAGLDRPDLVIGLEHLFLREHRRLFSTVPLLYVPLSLVAPIEIESYGLPGICGMAAKRLFASIQKWALRAAEATVRFSEMSCRALDNYYCGAVDRRYEVNRIAVEIPRRFARPGDSSPLRLLTVGRLVESKNVEFALRELAQLRTGAWQFDIVGNGERLESIKTLSQDLQLGERVICHGRVPDTEQMFLNSDLFLFTSRIDNSPLAVLESMSFGVPVVGIQPDGARHRTGIAELVHHGQTGLLAADEDDFKTQLEWAFNNPSELARMGEAARRFVEENHTWEKHLARYEMLFDELISFRRPRAMIHA